MIDYIKRHEHYVSDSLESCQEAEKLHELMVYHDKQISWMQHERLAHLITMLFVCLFFLMTFGFTMIHFTIPCILLTALLLALTAAYILHYYRLENSIQGWYSLSNKIRMKLFQLK